jgi:ABC-type multidrug transport system ATPase subunit/pSer/pThr/pTyr-binding forkhead associated (FHA) protein
MYKVEIIWGEKVIEKILIENDSIVIGRGNSDVIIESGYISKAHCKIYVKRNNLYIEDLDSTNGTYINERRIEKYNPYIITPYDDIKLTKSGLVKIKVYKKEKGEIIRIGRAEDNDIVIKLPTISRYHARIIKEGGKLYIEDLGSTNGTFVNGKRVYGKVEILPGSKISLGSYILEVQTPEKFIHSSLIEKGIELIGIGLSYYIKNKPILENVDFFAKSGELIGIIGPSGGGKTTLLTALAGYLPKSKGSVILNGEDLYENFDSLCINIGYAPQDDIVHSELTVFQSLYYTAKLRLPEDTKEGERVERIEKVLKELGISHIKNIQIGSPEKKTISGGERKRVNIAQELISDPPILFLDEPATGLDPHWKKDVVEHLRKLADSGKIVIAVTHDIKDKVSASYFDKIILIAGGKEIYFGPSNELFTFFGKDDIADIFKEMNEPSKREEWYKKFMNSKYYKMLKEKVSKYKIESEKNREFMKANKKRNMFKQLITLTERYLIRKISDRLNTIFLLSQAIVVGLIFTFLFPKLDETSLLLLGISGCWFGLFNSMREIVSERAIYRREKKVGVGIFPYVSSKILVLGLIGLIQSILLLVVVGIKIKEVWQHFALMFLTILLSIYVSTSLGLFISSIIPRQEPVIPLVVLITIFQLVFCGILKPLNEMPLIMRIFADFTPSRWVIETLFNIVGEKTGSYLGFGTNLFLDIFVLIAFFISFFVLCNISLEMKEE